MRHSSHFRHATFLVILFVGVFGGTFPCPCAAQQPALQGVIRFANATALAGRVIITIDGTKLRPDGFGSGENTGGVGILAGTHRFEASNANAKPAQTSVTIQPSASVTILAYTKSIQETQNAKPVDTLQLLAHVNPPHQPGRHFEVIYVSSRPTIDLMVNGQNVKLAALRELKIEGGTIKIEYAGKPITTFSATEGGNFLAVIFDKSDGTVGGVVLPDYT